jgi:hypothetical protein
VPIVGGIGGCWLYKLALLLLRRPQLWRFALLLLLQALALAGGGDVVLSRSLAALQHLAPLMDAWDAPQGVRQ